MNHRPIAFLGASLLILLIRAPAAANEAEDEADDEDTWLIPAEGEDLAAPPADLPCVPKRCETADAPNDPNPLNRLPTCTDISNYNVYGSDKKYACKQVGYGDTKTVGQYTGPFI